MTLLQSGLAKSLAEDYTIDNSLRFSSDSFLQRTPSVVSNRKTYTLSVWVKRAQLEHDSEHQAIFSTAEDASEPVGDRLNYLSFQGSGTYLDKLRIGNDDGSMNLVTDAVYRDPSAWYHIVWVTDTTQVTNTNRVKLYVNNELQSFGVSTYPDQDQELGINLDQVHKIGQNGYNSASDFDGYMAEFYFIDGTALTPSDFGETSSTTNQWIPKDAVDDLTFGTNGFYQKYAATELADSFEDSANSVTHIVSAVGNSQISTAQYKFGSSSGLFDGSGDELTVPASGEFNFGTGDFTLEFWARFDDVTSSDDHYYFFRQAGTEWFHFIWRTTDNSLFFNSADTGYAGQGTWNGVVDTWYHIALVRNGTAFTSYVDGAVIGTSTESSSDVIGQSTEIQYIMGGDPGDSDMYSMDGYVDSLRISNTARYTSAFTVPSAAFEDDQYTRLLLNFVGSNASTTFTDSSGGSGGRHTITANGDVTNSRAVRKVGDSSIKFDGTGDYLSIPDSSDWDLYETTATTFTYEAWIKFASTPGGSTYECWFAQWEDDDNKWQLGMTSGAIQFYLRSGGSTIFNVTSGTITDTNWHHVAWVKNGTSIKTFLDGVLGLDTTKTDTDTLSGGLYIGTIHGVSQLFDGYMTEIRVSDVARYTATFTTFGQDGGTIASPTPFTADSNTKLLIHSNWDGGLGADSSGNYNTFTPTNLVATDQVLDSPTNNWATCRVMNSPISSGAGFTEGNLYFTSGTTGGGRNTDRMSVSTILANSGKWYAECMVFSTTSFFCGVGTNQVLTAYTADNTRYAYVYGVDGKALLNTDGSESWITYGSAFSTGDIVQVYIDMDASTPEVYFGKNGSWGDGSGNFDETTPTSAVVLGDTFFTADTDNAGFFEFQFSSSTGGTSAQGQFNFGQDSTFSGQTTAGGYSDTNEIGDFKYTVPSGAKALCVSNLPDPEIALPGDYFNTVLWDGDDADPRTISGLNFQPDAIWVKARSGTYGTQDHCLNDAVRGAGEILRPDRDYAEATDTNNIESFTSDGWTMGDDGKTNKGSTSYVGWSWKAGGAPTADNSAGAGATPTAGSVKIDGANLGSALAGSIAATRLSANTETGFSIIKFTGTGANATIAHGLSKAPELWINKNLIDIDNWMVGTTVGTLDAGDYLKLNTSMAAAVSSGVWNDAPPTSSVINLGADGGANGSTDATICYAFHSVEGYSKVGSYEGNGDLDGTFVYTGFRPAFVMTKSVDSTSDWQMFDNKRTGYNVDNYELEANDNAAEDTSTEFIDIVSNGFKNRDTTDPNVAETYLYIAFAESPFKYSNAR